MADAQGVFCPHCGTALPSGARFCASCGQPMAPVPAPFAPESGAGARRKWLTLGVVTAVVAIAGVAAVLGLRGGGSSNAILLGVADRDGRYDVHMLNVGEEPTRDNRALEGIDNISSFNLVSEGVIAPYYSYLPAVHLGNHWLVDYYTDDYQSMAISSIDQDGEEELYDSDYTDAYVAWDQPSSSLRVTNNDSSGSSECLVSDGVDRADRVRRSDYCYWIGDGVLVSYDNSGDEFDLEVELADGASYSLSVDNWTYPYAVSADGRYAALGQQDSSGDVHVEFYNLATGDKVAETDDSNNYWNAGRLTDTGSRLYASTYDDRDHYTMVIFDPAREDMIEIEDGRWADANSDGSIAFVQTNQDEQQGLVAMNLSTYETVDLGFSEDWLQWAVTPQRGAIVVDPSGDISLAAPNGDIQELGRVDVNDTGEGITARMVGDTKVVLNTQIWDSANESNIYFIDLSGVTMTALVTNWTSTGGYDTTEDGSYVVFTGSKRVHDDMALYAVRADGSESPIALDDDGDAFWDISIKGNDVYYTARVGDNPDDYEVRKVSITSAEDPEVLYEGARLFATAWDQPTRYLMSDY